MEIWNRAREFLGGIPEENAALDRLALLDRKTTLSRRDKVELPTLKQRQRRLLLKRMGFTGGLIATGGLGALAYACSRPRAETSLPLDIPTIMPLPTVISPSQNFSSETERLYELGEKTYMHYADGFEQIAKFDEESATNLAFMKERRRRGILLPKGNSLVPIMDAGFDPELNFSTAILAPEYSGFLAGQEDAFASNLTDGRTVVVMLRDTPVSTIWAGLVLDHEVFHVKQAFQERGRPVELPIPSAKEKRARAELDAYTHELRMINKLTSGEFDIAIAKMAGQIRESMPLDVDGNLLAGTEKFFGPALGELEMKNRKVVYVVALNFKIAELRISDTDQIKRKKLDFIIAALIG